MSRCLMIQGTSSDAGKSRLAEQGVIDSSLTAMTYIATTLSGDAELKQRIIKNSQRK